MYFVLIILNRIIFVLYFYIDIDKFISFNKKYIFYKLLVCQAKEEITGEAKKEEDM